MGKINRGQDKRKSKLTRTYRFKKKAGIVKKHKDNDATSDSKKAKIIIRNLPFKVTEADLRKLYEPFGKIDEIKLLKRPDGKPVGCGFVQFECMESASKAIFKTNKLDFLGRTISSEWAIPKSQYVEKIKNEEEPEIKDEGDNEESFNEQQTEDVSEIIEETSKPKDKKHPFSQKFPLSKIEQRKLYKLKKRLKRSRIVIRNLPFTVTEDVIKDCFSKYGNIDEINILKKPDGRPTGCCFLQFDRVQSAAQAIHHENMKPILNRPMVVDWAVPKDKFQKSNPTAEVKVENDEDNEVSFIREEKNENFKSGEVKIKEEKDSDDEDIKNEDDSSEEEGSGSSEQESDNESEELDKKKNIKMESDEESQVPHPRRISNDVTEGRTVFIKNVPFHATNQELKECMEQFGPVFYALICMDSLTEHSKGTAFVKFRNVEDAEKCLSAGTELRLHDQVLDPHKALHRNEVNQKHEEKQKKIKDSRNLYLVKEGVILAGSPAAQDVSASDMARRLQLEQWKSQMLRNLNMFVSRVRLVIHNLPSNVDDSQLRQLFKKHSNSNAIITEARVMRDLRNVDANGIGKSKEHGFVSFTNHEDALKALRSINNNPNIFTKTKRPIVAFSIENRIMVNAKQRRVDKSRQQNPLFNKRKNEQITTDDKFSKKRKKSVPSKSNESNEKDVEDFAGITGKPGVSRLNGKFFIKKQAAMHTENVKQQKKKIKSMKQLTAKKKERSLNRKEAKPKQGTKKPDKDEVHFARLVNNYKNKLTNNSSLKSKWYET